MSGDDFYERVWEIVRCIPRGKVTTYGHIAVALGMRSSARTVGWALNAAAGRDDIPAHRVVNRCGELTGRMHFATPTLMRELLEAEGVTFDGDRVRLDRHLWIPNANRRTDRRSERSRDDARR
jgi:O-6-methylguanine DNA methyltransferase